jgi:hypothetical protein
MIQAEHMGSAAIRRLLPRLAGLGIAGATVASVWLLHPFRIPRWAI